MINTLQTSSTDQLTTRLPTMDFNANIVLENNRVKLRPLHVDDLTNLLPFALNEPELWQFSLISASGAENMKAYMTHALNERANERAYPFVVIDQLSGEIAGSTRFYDFQRHHNTTQLGFTWYGKKFQGTGLNKQCKYLMLTYAFDVLKLDRVEFARIIEMNDQSTP